MLTEFIIGLPSGAIVANVTLFEKRRLGLLTEIEEQEYARVVKRWKDFSLGGSRKSPFDNIHEIRLLSDHAELWLGIREQENDLWVHGLDVFKVWVRKAEAGDRHAARNLLVNFRLALDGGDKIPPILAKWVARCLGDVLDNNIDMASAFSLSKRGKGFSNRQEIKTKQTRAIQVWREVEIIRLQTGSTKNNAREICKEKFGYRIGLEKIYEHGQRLILDFLEEIQKPEK